MELVLELLPTREGVLQAELRDSTRDSGVRPPLAAVAAAGFFEWLSASARDKTGSDDGFACAGFPASTVIRSSKSSVVVEEGATTGFGAYAAAVPGGRTRPAVPCCR